MLEELLKYDKLGSKDELLILLFQILSPEEYKNIEDVKTICIHHSYTFGSSFNGIIRLLELLHLIKIQRNQIIAESIISRYNPLDFFDKPLIFERLFNLIMNSGKLGELFNYKSTKLDNETLIYYVRESQIPFYLNCIKKFLINTGFLFKQGNVTNTYFINPLFKDFFTALIVPNIKKNYVKRKLSLIELKRIQSLQSEYGDQAEEYVLNFEIRRLSNHPLRQEIKRISQDFANAGFDIESFNTEDSIMNDRLIEVKSYSGNLSFYWSKNEIETAKEMTDCYFLYLVDRTKIMEDGYCPYIIQDPYKNLFLNDQWQKDANTYFVSISKLQ